MTEATVDRQPLERDRIAALYESHAAAALRFAFLLIGRREAAEDVVHEAFLRVFGRFADRRSPDFFRPYLNRTIVNLVRSEQRRAGAERSKLPRLRTSGVHTDPNVDPRPDVVRALATLPVRQRAAIVLRYYEDLSEAQVADIMRCSRPAVRSLVARGSESLRPLLEGLRHGI